MGEMFSSVSACFSHFVFQPVCDVFVNYLSNGSDSYVDIRTKGFSIRVRTSIRLPLPPNPTTPPGAAAAHVLSTSDTAQTPLFCILDEAQHAATHHSPSAPTILLHTAPSCTKSCAHGRASRLGAVFHGHSWQEHIQRQWHLLL